MENNNEEKGNFAPIKPLIAVGKKWKHSLEILPNSIVVSSKTVLRTLHVIPRKSDKLFDGVKEFHSKDFIENQEIFKTLCTSQHPHTLFIGCSDSRVVPNLITKSLPGELFIIRNIANLVPFYNKNVDNFLATSSAIEYAVKVLNVENIIICGHSNCGGCQALYYDKKKMHNLPHTRKWLELAKDVKAKIEKSPEIMNNPHEREWVTEQLNVVEQMNHLLTYPHLKEKYEKGELSILGWYYVIETGEIYHYSPDENTFIRIE